jgi:transposase-like protein
LLEAFRAGDGVDLIRDAVRVALQELIEIEATERIGAASYERTDTRVTERNGHRPRVLATKAGDVELRIPKLRKGSFLPVILEPRRRIDQALYAVVMEAYVHGVSTRRVDDLVEAMGVDSGISKSEVSRICARLDESVGAFRTRSLEHTGFPYVYLDATYLNVRNTTGQVVSMAVVVATGIAADGSREVLGLDVGDSEDETFWRGLPHRAEATRPARGEARDLRSARGPGEGAQAVLPRLRAPAVPGSLRPEPACPRPEVARRHGRRGAPHHLRPARRRRGQPYLGRGPRPADQIVSQDRSADDEAKTEVTAFTDFPRPHWQKIWSPNPLERVNKEIKRRARVVGIFPNPAAVIRLVGAVLADMHDEWQSGDRRYLSETSMALLNTDSDTEPTAAIDSGE